MLQQWRTRVLRWHQLSRYYLNKWQYDGSKWAERVWYGRGSQSPTSVASVPFMLTRQMRLDLERAGFPAHEIAALLPRTAHQLLTDKVSYAQFRLQQQTQQTQQQQQPAAAAAASAADAHKEIHAIVQAIEARAQPPQSGATDGPSASQAPSSVVMVVPAMDESDQDRKAAI
ncbi:hypothetical protein P43SY_001900 [Pythium insidiosum]|uniref:Uncharacterized protein n=1 Tax=Pythium insidiosum TaxID=114742 RepID=A0AAD5M6B6_PYTIN|nr:hypothetical protein P43SY_001900 [Pythium insidiosum]